MARPLRVHLADGWYHAFSRGLNRMAIFCDDRDRRHFLDLLEETVARFRLRLHAYALMENHYHLLVQTPDANLSRAMQWLNLSYAAWFNVRYQRTGPVFQRPYKAVPVEDGAWAYELSVYIHLNPLRIEGLGLSRSKRSAVRAGSGAPPSRQEVLARLRRLRMYKWSSYPGYAGYVQPPAWLCTTEILARAGAGARGDAKSAYRRTVQGRLSAGTPPPELEVLRDGLAIGGADFLRLVRDAGQRMGIARDVAAKRSLRERCTVADVIRAVEGLKGEAWSAFRDRHADAGTALAIWAARQWTGLTLREIGEAMGGMDYAAASAAVRRLTLRARNDPVLAGQMRGLAEMLNVEMSPQRALNSI